MSRRKRPPLWAIKDVAGRRSASGRTYLSFRVTRRGRRGVFFVNVPTSLSKLWFSRLRYYFRRKSIEVEVGIDPNLTAIFKGRKIRFDTFMDKRDGTTREHIKWDTLERA